MRHASLPATDTRQITATTYLSAGLEASYKPLVETDHGKGVWNMAACALVDTSSNRRTTKAG